MSKILKRRGSFSFKKYQTKTKTLGDKIFDSKYPNSKSPNIRKKFKIKKLKKGKKPNKKQIQKSKEFKKFYSYFDINKKPSPNYCFEKTKFLLLNFQNLDLVLKHQ